MNNPSHTAHQSSLERKAERLRVCSCVSVMQITSDMKIRNDGTGDRPVIRKTVPFRFPSPSDVRKYGMSKSTAMFTQIVHFNFPPVKEIRPFQMKILEFYSNCLTGDKLGL